jgi:hypothetical protein
MEKSKVLWNLNDLRQSRALVPHSDPMPQRSLVELPWLKYDQQLLFFLLELLSNQILMQAHTCRCSHTLNGPNDERPNKIEVLGKDFAFQESFLCGHKIVVGHKIKVENSTIKYKM